MSEERYFQEIMKAEDFWKQGFLHEVNRLFLHPLGMALPISKNPKTGEWVFGHIQVNTDDAAGILFADGTLSAEKIDFVRERMDEAHASRLAKHGYVVQPKPGSKPFSLPEVPSDIPEDAITDFRGPYRWLSNFHEAPVRFEGAEYMSNEHAYQAAKCVNDEEAVAIREAPNCFLAKKMGGRVQLRDDWEDIKLWVMLTINREKYLRHRDIRKQLLDTGDRVLLEGNTWNDRFWGVFEGEGENWLGRILMQVRDELR